MNGSNTQITPEMLITVDPIHLGLLKELGRKYQRGPEEVARRILDAALSEGITLCENLLEEV